MSWARDTLQKVIVRRPGVFVQEDEGERGTCGVAVADPAEDLHLVCFSPGGRSLASALAAGDVLFEILLLEFDSNMLTLNFLPNEFI